MRLESQIRPYDARTAPPFAEVQANLGRVSKYAEGQTRDWSLFFFFRIMKESEVKTTRDLFDSLRKAGEACATDKPGPDHRRVMAEAAAGVDSSLSNPTTLIDKGGNAEEELAATEAAEGDGADSTGAPTHRGPQPADAFFAWLRLVANGDRGGLGLDRTTAEQTALDLFSIAEAGPAFDPETELHLLCGMLDDDGDVLTIVDTILSRIAGHILTHRNRPETLSQIVDTIIGFGACLTEKPVSSAVFFHRLTEMFRALLANRTLARLLIGQFGGTPQEAGRFAVRGKLPLTCFYELLRQAAPAFWRRDDLTRIDGVDAAAEAAMNDQGMESFLDIVELTDAALDERMKRVTDKPEKAASLREQARDLHARTGGPSMLRAEAEDEAVRAKRDKPFASSSPPLDPAPINIAFTYSGLDVLRVHPVTLASFPGAFKEGMAARAEHLGDTGPSAPEFWDGELGLKSVHGYFLGGFQAGSKAAPVTHEAWLALREDIRLFNGRIGPRGQFLRTLLGTLFRVFGMEIVHIEMGQDPYRLDEEGRIEKLEHRLEHFGFRDGLSQPFVNMGLKDPPAGGGTPRRNRTWGSVAPGEIFLGHPDADGVCHRQPCSHKLRHNGTFLVFRKLEQDVAGFRNFLKNQRPDDEQEQERLAAQFMGRWKNGTPLVVAPKHPRDLGRDLDGKLNDFLYAADDPNGERCPLGAHARRSNPRDIGGPGVVDRHRILRRSIAYGGPLLDDDSPGDGEKRGLLFVAANSRIEQQFEVIQSRWINHGEFLGQAGLGRCPMIGANDGTVWDSFCESGSIARVTHLPRFVITRGGDYFFAPSASAIRVLARGEADVFAPEKGEEPPRPFRMGFARTPALFDPQRIRTYIGAFMSGVRSIRVPMPETSDRPLTPDRQQPADPDRRIGGDVVFIGTHQDVRQVMSDNRDDDDKNYHFSVAHYRQTARRVTRGHDIPVGTERGPVTGAARRRLHRILYEAWTVLEEDIGFSTRWPVFADAVMQDAIRRTARSGRIDLIQDLATDTIYGIIAKFYGIEGPDWLTEIAPSLPFARQHVGQLHPDWLSVMRGEAPRNPRMTTMQIWSILFLADLIANVTAQEGLKSLSRQCCSEFLIHIETLLKRVRQDPPVTPATLLDAFVANEERIIDAVRNSGEIDRNPDYSVDDYYFDVTAILLETTAATMANVPAIFGKLMSTLLDLRIDVATLLPLLTRQRTDGDTSGLRRLIYETDRISPSFGLFLRHCEKDIDLDGTETPVKQGDWLLALVNAANLDASVFEQPTSFSLAPFLPGRPRDLNDYLLFGASGGDRVCFGRDHLALSLLERLFINVASIQGLRRVPGPEGDLKDIARVNIGLKARFARTS